MKGGEKWVRWKIEDALSLHPNYVNLLGWQSHDALAFLREKPDLIEHGLRTMGYRLVPTRVTYPAEFHRVLGLKSQWVNRGVGRATRDYAMRVTLVDERGTVAAKADAGTVDTDAWIKGQTYADARDVTFEGVAPGAYRLCLSLTDPRDGKPIQLPLHNRREDGSYDIGVVRSR
jgi:hypothetical protein